MFMWIYVKGKIYTIIAFLFLVITKYELKELKICFYMCNNALEKILKAQLLTMLGKLIFLFCNRNIKY